ncbi:acetyl-CoA acetyltransferase [Mycolicibacter kumamotonensis]|uniref:Acetyl-CoA acetyltransferase n=1 Tax=Mycolicibacter kumamotonensis TaxID=354243 RepID=A0A1X0EFR2_9MYCO|nr:acetyl-CoA acetyltransferase [Mycolicibacter kumamotonensis]ORA83522.1 acetyl-CoA acetyltransferase [Mycolicibacter kumamotonensis]
MDPAVWIIGAYQSDFGRNLSREGRDYADLADEVVAATLGTAGLAAADVDVVHVGNAFGELFAGQGHLGAMPATVDPALWGTPASRHEAACASGSVATRAAIADLAAGFHDVALVVGLELERTVPSDVGAAHLGAAAWAGHEGADANNVWASVFSQVADEYDRRYGLDEAHLRSIATTNLGNARRNPNAQTRAWTLPDLTAEGDDDAVNPIVEGRLRRYDCSQLTDGGAGLVLVSDRYLRDHPRIRPLARIEGWGQRTVGLGLQQKLQRDHESPYVMPHVHQAVQEAFNRARVTLDDVDGFEVHDCFTPSEYLAIDHIGLTEPGQSWKAIENGDIAIGGSLPINPSGGLIGGGHPVGATGIRMLVDAAKQVSDNAGDYQVPGARRFGTLNIGGSTATTVSFIVGAPAERA